MSTQQVKNRVEDGMNKWRLREERLNNLFSFDVSRNKAFMKDKLRYYDEMAARYKGTANPEERYYLRMLKQERRELSRLLFPNRFIRFLYWAIVRPTRRMYVVRQETRQEARKVNNMDSLKKGLDRTGFGSKKQLLEQYVQQGKPAFSIPASRGINAHERLEYNLSFSRDANGTYRMDGYKAALHNGQKQEKWRQQYFDRKTFGDLSSMQVYNLLSGRPMLLEQFAKDGAAQHKWIQLDFTQKDANSNFGVKEFGVGYTDNLRDAVRKLPLKELKDERATEQLFAGLKAGNRQAVHLQKDGKEELFHIEANPRMRSIRVYNSHGKNVGIMDALGWKADRGAKQSGKMTEGRRAARPRSRGIRT